jgi:hypothetical protein
MEMGRGFVRAHNGASGHGGDAGGAVGGVSGGLAPRVWMS